MKEILGKKIGMTRIFKETGEMVPVTVIEAGPCPVVAKTVLGKRGAGYQVGFGAIRAKLVNKPKAGHFAKAGVPRANPARRKALTEGRGRRSHRP